MEKLALVIPIYNEQGAIGEVLTNWVLELRRLNISFSIMAFNDGSKDNTSSIIQKQAQQFPEIIRLDKTNKGHGPTILEGYRMAVDEGFDWIFQIDGDNEMTVKEFSKLWEAREHYDYLVGNRINRESPWARRIISTVSYWTVKLFYGGHLKDVNCPYRLMRASFFKPAYSSIPADTFAPNVILAGIACFTGARTFETTAHFSSRKTGSVSIKKWKLLKAAFKSFSQTIQYIQVKRAYLKEAFHLK